MVAGNPCMRLDMSPTIEHIVMDGMIEALVIFRFDREANANLLKVIRQKEGISQMERLRLIYETMLREESKG